MGRLGAVATAFLCHRGSIGAAMLFFSALFLSGQQEGYFQAIPGWLVFSLTFTGTYLRAAGAHKSDDYHQERAKAAPAGEAP